MAQQPNMVGGVLERIAHYPDHLQAIGLVITEFGRLEGTLALLFWELMGDPARADGVFWTLGNSKARCDVIRGVANETLQGDEWQFAREDIMSIVADTRTAANQRNDIAHGQWGTPAARKADPFVSLRRPATKSPIFQRRWTVAELEALASQIAEVDDRASQLHSALMFINHPDVRMGMLPSLKITPGATAYFRKLLEPLHLDHLLD